MEENSERVNQIKNQLYRHFGRNISSEELRTIGRSLATIHHIQFDRSAQRIKNGAYVFLAEHFDEFMNLLPKMKFVQQ